MRPGPAGPSAPCPSPSCVASPASGPALPLARTRRYPRRSRSPVAPAYLFTDNIDGCSADDDDDDDDDDDNNNINNNNNNNNNDDDDDNNNNNRIERRNSRFFL